MNIFSSIFLQKKIIVVPVYACLLPVVVFQRLLCILIEMSVRCDFLKNNSHLKAEI